MGRRGSGIVYSNCSVPPLKSPALSGSRFISVSDTTMRTNGGPQNESFSNFIQMREDDEFFSSIWYTSTSSQPRSKKISRCDHFLGGDGGRMYRTRVSISVAKGFHAQVVCPKANTETVVPEPGVGGQ